MVDGDEVKVISVTVGLVFSRAPMRLAVGYPCIGGE